MANEILKDEILNDEILNDEQLDGVAGGTFVESSQDCFFFHDIGFDMQKGPINYTELERAWARAGIAFVPDSGATNEYYQNGKQIPRAKALEIAMKKAGKKIDLRPYYV